MTTTPLMNRRSFNLLAVSALAAIHPGLARAMDGADVPWRSDDPHLLNSFLPVAREIEQTDLIVTQGAIPAELRGTYLRNGPNPLYKPNQYTYPLDGDGMVHALRLDGGRASYRNRFVKTAGLELERRAGRAVYGSVVHPLPIEPALFLPTDSRSPIKNGTCINVMRHGGRILALGEANAAYELDEQLETLGPWMAGRDEPLKLGAHNRRHPVTGELYALEYSVRAPQVNLHRIGADGRWRETRAVQMPAAMMIHDFVLTERHIVLVAGPAVFDFSALGQGKAPLQWQPERGTTIAVLPLDGGKPLWLQGEAFFVYHFANGFERGGDIVVDYVHHERFTLGHDDPTSLRRLTIRPGRASFAVEPLSAEETEFPVINPVREALPTRYVYAPVRGAGGSGDDGGAPVFNGLAKHDMDRGRSTRWDAGARIVGEPVYLPRPSARHEDDGYLGAYAYDPAQQSSSFVLLDALRIEAGPVAVIQMPQRVPQGLHGNWLAQA